MIIMPLLCLINYDSLFSVPKLLNQKLDDMLKSFFLTRLEMTIFYTTTSLIIYSKYLISVV